MRALAILLLASAGLSAGPRTVVFIGDDGALREAAQRGMYEAEQQAEFLGIEYKWVFVDSAADAAKHPGAYAVVAAVEPEAAAEALPDTAVFNVVDRDNALRTRCRPNLFHTAPSWMMISAAEEQWKQSEPDDHAIEAHAWHPRFVKFAGRELNNRWREHVGREMTDDDWAVWAAYRLIADAVAQNPDASPADLIPYFREEMEFDGQKGAYMTFRPTGQLRQPLLITVAGRLSGEAPVRGVAAADDLDSLGAQECKP